MGRIREMVREGAMDALGFTEEREVLREQAYAGQMLARRVEDFNFGDLLQFGNSSTYFDPDRATQLTQTYRAYKYFFNDPVIKRSVMLRSLYTFGRGMGVPKYRPDTDKPEVEAAAGGGAIERYWADPENQAALTSPISMFQKDIESCLQANVFLLIFRSQEKAARTLEYASAKDPSGKMRPSSCKVTDLPETEIVDVITHPANDKMPVYYKRQFRPKTYDFTVDQGAGAWQASGNVVTVYYRHWRNVAPTVWGKDAQGEPIDPADPRCVATIPWGPIKERIADGVVYHVFENKTSSMRFGVSDLQAVLKWAKGLNEYMSSRMATVQAISQLALRIKAKGGAKNVGQVASSIMDLQKLAGVVDGSSSTQLTRTPSQTGVTKATVETGNMDVQPMVQDTGSQNAQGDITTMKGQISAGTGVPLQHLADPSVGALATATSMDGPLLRLIQWNQERWETVHRDILGYMLEGLGLDPARLEIDMPPILERDVANTAAYLGQIAAVIDPNGANVKLHRFMLGEILDAMGKQNAKELVDRLIPEDSASPFDQNLALAQAAGQPGADTSAAAVTGQDDKTTTGQRAGSALQQTAAAAAVSDNQGKQRGADGLPGGPEGGSRAARDRATTRWGIAQETLFDPDDVDRAEVDAAFDELVEGLTSGEEFPSELLEAAERAMAQFDDLPVA